MHSRSFYDAVLRNPEDGGGTAAPADTGAAPVDTGSSSSEPASVDTPSADQPPPLEDQLSKIWDRAHSPVDRDESGRFRSKNPSPYQTDLPADDGGQDDDLDPEIDADLIGARAPTDGDGEDDPTAGTEPAVGAKAPTNDMPRSWSKDDEKAWAAMPKEARDVVLKREQQMATFVGQAGNAVRTLKANEPILQGVEPWKDYLAARENATGVPAGRLVNDIIRMAHGFDTAQSNDAKLGVLQEIVGAFGIDLSPWIGADAAQFVRGQQQQSSDPRVEQLMQTVNDLQSRLQQRDQQEQQASFAQVDNAFKSFEENVKTYPWFKHVRHQMGALIGTVPADDPRDVQTLLKDLYEQAIWTHPKIRARILRDQQAQTKDSHLQDLSKRSDAARKAAAGNVKSGVPSPSKRTMEQDIEAAADRLYRGSR